MGQGLGKASTWVDGAEGSTFRMESFPACLGSVCAHPPGPLPVALVSCSTAAPKQWYFYVVAQGSIINQAFGEVEEREMNGRVACCDSWCSGGGESIVNKGLFGNVLVTVLCGTVVGAE